MIRIRKKKCAKEPCGEEAPCKEAPQVEADAFYAGAFPGKPWDRLTKIRHARGLVVKILNEDEQKRVIELARRYFALNGKDFPSARMAIQNVLDQPHSAAAVFFFKTAIVTEKRLVIRAYLSDADGRFVSPEAALPLLSHVADAGLDFEVGAIDHYIEGQRKTEFVVGDGTEVISDKGYWFAHTHPAKTGVTENVLPSTGDLDVMIATARGLAHNLRKTELVNYVMRDIGATRVTVTTSIGPRPSPAKVEHVTVEYYYAGGDDPSINAHVTKLATHLRTRHHLSHDRISITRRSTRDDVLRANR